MASRLTAVVRCVRVASMPTIRPAMTMVRTMATASKKAPPPAPVKKAPAQIVKEEIPAEEQEGDYTPPTTAEAKPVLVRELKEEMKENQTVINDDQSISQEYLTEVNGTVSVEAGSKDTILSFSSNGYDIRVRWNSSEYEEPEDHGEQAQFSEGEQQQEPKDDEEPKTGRIPFEIDVSNGKNTVRFTAESTDNACILGSMSFPDLVKEARAREALAAGKQPDEADTDIVGDEVDLAHMSDNSHDALQAFLESIKIDDQLAQFVVHHCLLQQRLAHQRVVEKFVAFTK